MIATRRLGRALHLLAGAALSVVVLLVAGPAYAEGSATPAPSVAPSALAQAQELVATPAIGKVGTETLVQLRGWPAGATVQVSTCGNNALNGNADCDNAGSISATTSADGTFTGRATFSKPPKPCPCVLHAFSSQSSQVNNFPIELTGYPTAPPVADSGTRKLEIRSEVEGGGPLSSWFGAAAAREVVLTLTNTGTLPLENPPTTIALGKGQDPTDLLTLPRLGAIAPGQTTEVRVPFELPAFSFGSYTVKTTVAGLDEPTTARGTASTYPWFLLIGGWLLIQIPLLGLHKRRRPEPGEEAPGDLLELDDPFRDLVPSSAAVFGAAAVSARPGPAPAASAGVPAWANAATGLTVAGVGAAAGTALLERPTAEEALGREIDAAVPAWAASVVVDPIPAPAPVTPSGAPSAVAAVAAAMAVSQLPESRPAYAALYPTASLAGAYGVGHLRAFVDPDATPGTPTAIAARVVVGGVSPRR